MKIFSGFCALLLLASFLAVTPVAAVTPGQIDTFEDGTTQNWVVNILHLGVHPAPPKNVDTGGPAGAGDHYLLLTAVGGSGAGSRLSVINLAQWAGNYLTAPVNAIRMDVNNLGASDLYLRLLVADPMGGPPADEAFSTNPIVVPTGSGWMRVEFPLSPSDLTADSGTVSAALANVTELRIFHSNATPVLDPPVVVAQLGVDNITAVPLPGAFWLLGSSLMGLIGWRRFRKG